MDAAKNKKPPVLIRYLATLTFVLILYGAYAILAVPALEGSSGLMPQRTTGPKFVTDPTVNVDYELEDIFEPGSWELERCKTLVTRFGKVLFKDYQPNDDGTILIKPITMILNDRKEKKESTLPFVLQSAKGAVLKFDKPISLGEPVGNLEGGRFLGAVRLFRKNYQSQQLDVLMETHNLQFSEKRIYTLEDITFRFGQHSGSGRNMNIELIDDDIQAKQRNSNSRLRGVKFLEVAQLNELILQPATDEDAFENQLQPIEKPPVVVKCKGTFKINFQDQVATLFDKVTVTQRGIGEHAQLRDQLNCDRLKIAFSNQTPETQTESESKEKWEVDRLVAIGSPAVLDFQSKNAQAIAEILEYDMKRSRVIAKSQDQSKTIYLRHGTKELEAKDIDYKMSDDGKLGSLRSNGPGKLIVRSSESNSVTEVHWVERFDIRDYERKKVASMYGGVTIIKATKPGVPSNNSSTGLKTGNAANWRMSAHELHVWLLEETNANATEVTSVNKQANEADDPAVVPEKVYASGHIVIESDRLHVETREIKAFWPGASQQISQRRSAPLLVGMFCFSSLNPIAACGGLLWSNPVGTNNNQVQLQSASQRWDSKPKLFASGDSIQLQMEPYDSDDVEIRELTIDGNAKLWQPDKKTNQNALEVTGNQLRWIPRHEDLAQVTVAALPNQNAVLLANGAELYGNVIKMDQLENKAWIEGPGFLHINRNQSASTETQPSSIGNAPQKLSVQWVGGMVFDGTNIYFEQDVITKGNRLSVTGERSILDATSHSMTAKLVRHFSFSQTENSDSEKDLEINSITLGGELDPGNMAFPDRRSKQSRMRRKVTVANQVIKNNQLVEQARLTHPAIAIHDRLTRIDGEGPGLFRLTRLEDNGQLTFARVEFEREIKGRLDDQYIDVRGNVRCIQANINQWNQEFRFDDPITIENKMTRLVADQIQLAKWDKGNSPESMAEFTAVGNAKVFGVDYDAEAHRISYDQLSEKIVIVGGPRSDARIRYKQQGQSKPSVAFAERIDYFKNTQETKFHNLKRIETEHRSGQNRLNLNRK